MAEDGAEFRALARGLRNFDRRDEVVKALRKRMTEPAPAVRAAIKAHAVEVLPAGNGLGAWVAASDVTFRTTINGKAVRVRVRAGRSSSGAKSDIRAIDRGRVRHPSWGRRGRGQWHNQVVAAEFFTKPVRDADEWPAAIREAVSDAVRTINAG